MNVNNPNLFQRIFSRCHLDKVSPAVWFGLCLLFLSTSFLLSWALAHYNGAIFTPQFQKDKPVWLQILSEIIFPLVGGVVVLIGSRVAWLTYVQNKKKDEEQLHQNLLKYQQDKEHNEDLREQSRKNYELDKLQNQALRKQSQLQFEIKALNDNYTDILDRFSNPDSIAVRANAALRLAEIAQMPLPGNNLAFPSKPTEKTAENFPFFLRATAQLAAALHIETEQPVRTEIVKAVERMSQFVGPRGEQLAQQFIKDFADANRTARKNFVGVLGEYCTITPNVTDDYLRQFIGLAPFSNDSEVMLLCLTDLEESGEGQNATAVQRLHRRARQQDDYDKISDDLVIRFELKARQLLDARNALALSLDSVSSAPDKWFMENKPLTLSYCFLSGAVFLDLKLKWADLAYTYMHGMVALAADLTGTDLSHSKLQQAALVDGVLLDARFDHANLYRSNLVRARLERASFVMANLIDADCSSSHLDNTVFVGTMLEDREHDPPLFADFTNANWKAAFKGCSEVEDFFERNKERFGVPPMLAPEQVTEA